MPCMHAGNRGHVLQLQLLLLAGYAQVPSRAIHAAHMRSGISVPKLEHSS